MTSPHQSSQGVDSLDQNSQGQDWQAQLTQRHHLYGGPICDGVIRQQASDFIVIENLDFEAFGSGEHDWLIIRKTNFNSQSVADYLARIANVARSAVSFAGMKDNRAVTTQAFTVWRPQGTKGASVDYAAKLPAEMEVLVQDKHNKKLKRGSHRSNTFKLRVENVPGEYESELGERLALIREKGVPNYFGAQRFGRAAQNLEQVSTMFRQGSKGISRPLKSILLSSARSYLFNELVSNRIAEKRFAKVEQGEWLNLQGTASVFVSTEEDAQRMVELDVHPTAPMWGKGVDKWRDKAPDQIALEDQILEPFELFRDGLERFGLEYQRRPIRTKINELNWSFGPSETVGNQVCELEFTLQRGQFATSVLRELFNGIE